VRIGKITLNWIIVGENVGYIEVTADRKQWLDFVNAVIIHWILKKLGMNRTVTVALYTLDMSLTLSTLIRVMQRNLISREELCYKLSWRTNMIFSQFSSDFTCPTHYSYK
jgi:hypothetical protein